MKLCTQTKRADMLSSCATLIIQRRKEREREKRLGGGAVVLKGGWRVRRGEERGAADEEAIVPFTKATCFP